MRPGLPARTSGKIVTFAGDALIWNGPFHTEPRCATFAPTLDFEVARYVACVSLSVQTAYRLPALSRWSFVKLRAESPPGTGYAVHVLAPSVDTATWRLDSPADDGSSPKLR